MKTFRDLEIQGEPDDLNRLLETLGQHQSSWQRDHETEARINKNQDSKYVVLHTPLDANLVAATLYLYGNTEAGKMTLVNIVPSERGALTMDEYNQIAQDFNAFLSAQAEGISRLNLHLSNAELSADDILTPESAASLRQFSHLANKTTGSSHPLDKERWLDFICLVFRQKEQLSAESLRGVLVDQGWSESTAYDLTNEYEDGIAILKRYTETEA